MRYTRNAALLFTALIALAFLATLATGRAAQADNTTTTTTTSTPAASGSSDPVNDDPGQISDERIRDVAADFSASADEPHPDDIVAVATDRASAATVTDPGSHVATDQPVDVVVMHGDFTATRAKLIPGAEPPVGDVLEVTLDATTGEVTDWGLTDDTPPIDQLGDPQDITDTTPGTP